MFLAKADVELPDRTLRGLRTASDAELGIDARLLDAARAALAVPGDARLRKLDASGTFHRLFVLERGARPEGVMRVASLPGEPWTGLMRMESDASAFLRGHGLPVPECRFATVGDGANARGVSWVEWLDGETVSARDADDEATAARLELAAGFLAALHRIRGEGFGPLAFAGASRPRGACPAWGDYVLSRLDEHVEACTGIGAITADEGARIAALFRAAALEGDLDAEPAFLHGDPGGHNFIVNDRQLAGAIDWEDALLGDPLFDLASFCTFQPPRRHARMLAAYGVALEAGSPPWRRFWLYFLRIALAKTVHRYRFGYGDVPGRAPASARIQAALGKLDIPAK